jgi:hypothetical protein
MPLSFPKLPRMHTLPLPPDHTLSPLLVGFRRWAVFLSHQDHRPNLLNIDTCTNLLLHNLRFWNSPQYHIDLHNVVDVVVRDFEIHVDVFAQKAIYTAFNALDETTGLPIFPLNTGTGCGGACVCVRAVPGKWEGSPVL